MLNMNENLPKHTEFECKYRVEAHFLIDFKKIASSIPGLKNFIYVEGPDKYYTLSDGSFARYRKASHGLDHGRAEVTWKIKQPGAKNNIIRTEYNWRVDNTLEETITDALIGQGYKFNFSIVKTCHIYTYEDATIVFYTVYDTTDGRSTKTDTFVEIEVKEETIHNFTEDQAWDIINKYEKALEPIGVTPQKRMKRSLFEMYVREIR